MPLFKRISISGQYNAPLPTVPSKIKNVSEDYIRKTLLGNKDEAELIKEENIFSVDVDQIGADERKNLFNRLSEVIRSDFFGKFLPKQPIHSISVNNIAENTVYSYKAAEQKITLNDDDIKKFLTKEKHMQALMLHSNVGYILNKGRIDSMLVDRPKLIESFEEISMESFEEISMENIMDTLKEANMKGIEQAVNKFEKEGQIITALNSDFYVDIIKLFDKYSIRLGDGKFFVASDDIKITFRDPSETPSWATWFMGAVPLASIPDRATLFLMPPEEREKHFPKQLEDNPIICHASLWKFGEQTGVLLHTSWCHIAASYRWKINKPFEIASIMFRTASHPCHIARNFGFCPQLIIPGNEWF